MAADRSTLLCGKHLRVFAVVELRAVVCLLARFWQALVQGLAVGP